MDVFVLLLLLCCCCCCCGGGGGGGQVKDTPAAPSQCVSYELHTWLLKQLPMIAFTDDLSQFRPWMQESLCIPGMVLIFVTCCIAWGLEWSHVSVVHYTSALTLQVVPSLHPCT